MRAVLDTSVVVSGLISPHGTPAQVIARWRDGDFVLLYTPAMFEELKDVLSRTWLTERLAGVPNRIADYLEAVAVLGEVVMGYVSVTGQVRDPFDEMFLACAQLGKADYIVTVDLQKARAARADVFADPDLAEASQIFDQIMKAALRQ